MALAATIATIVATTTTIIIVTFVITTIVYLSLGLSPGKLHINCCGATITSFSLLKFHFLSFDKAIEFHSFKTVAMEEEVFFLFCLDKPITSVHEPSNCTF
jgi:hypothetical protein